MVLMIFTGRALRRVFFGVLCGCFCLLSACGSGATASSQGAGKTIQVVAAENFYCNLASQLSGSHVSVSSILSDTNAGLHGYPLNTNQAMPVTNAGLVSENSAGSYDW